MPNGYIQKSPNYCTYWTAKILIENHKMKLVKKKYKTKKMFKILKEINKYMESKFDFFS